MLFTFLIIVAAFVGFWLVTKIFPKPAEDRQSTGWVENGEEADNAPLD